MIVSEALVLLEIRRIAARELELPRECSPEDRLVEDLGLDSLTLTTLAVALEDRFQVIISDEEAGHIRTVGELARYVVSRVRLAPVEAAS